MQRIVLLALVTALVGIGGVAAVGRTTSDPLLVPVAIWEMNEPAGATVMTDSSGNGYDGSIGDHVTTGYVDQGVVSYRFPLVSNDEGSYDPGHVVTVPNTAALNPGTGNFSVTVSLRSSVNDRNIVQKGQSQSAGGYWKIENTAGVVDCLFRGSAGSGGVGTRKGAISDGAFHTITCTRTANQVQLTLDGTVVATHVGPTGMISNSSVLSIGGKTMCNGGTVECDPFVGEINRIEIDRPV